MRRVLLSPYFNAALALYAAGLSYSTITALCINDSCGHTANYGLMGYPWGIWGTLFYLTVSMLFLTGTKHPLQVLTLLGTGTHAYLIFIMIWDGFWCLTCLHIAFVALALAIASFMYQPVKSRLCMVPIGAACVLFFFGSHAYTYAEPDLVKMLQAANSSIVQDEAIPAGWQEPVAEPFPQATQEDTQPVSMEKPTQEVVNIEVLDFNKNPVVLDIKNQPVLFFAWWCSSCDAALKEVARMPVHERPALVATFFKDPDNLVSELQQSRGKALGLNPVYYALTAPVQGVPALLWHDGNDLRTAVGVSNISKVWPGI